MSKRKKALWVLYSIVMFSLVYVNVAHKSASAEESESSRLIISCNLAEGDTRILKFNLKNHETDEPLIRHFPYSIGEEDSGMLKDGSEIIVSGDDVVYVSNLPSAYNYKVEVQENPGYIHKTRNLTGRIRSALDRRGILESVKEDE